MENREVYHIEPGVKEIVITHKKGLDEKAPINIDVCGNIDSVTNFLNVRHAAMYKDEHVINDHDSLVLTKKEDRKIVLLYNSTHPFNHGTITGQLSLHPNFEKWGINTGQGWNNDELAEFIKMNRSYFKSKSDAMKLSGELKNLKVNVDKKIEASNDNRGNVKALTTQTVIDSSILKTFMINVPVFKGQPKKEFKVEVYVNPNNFQVTLMSPDANDIIEEVRDSIIDEQIEKIKRVAPGIPIIEQ